MPLLASVILQIKAESFSSYLYCRTITLTTLAGTTLADYFDRSLGIGYPGGSIALFTLVIASLAAWKFSLGSIDIKTVYTPATEAFYWITIMFSQTLGTALGDWMADSSGLGYNGSALAIALVLGVIALLYFFSKVSHVTLFWAAFILTRPLGATVANSLDKPISKGGLGISDLVATAILTGLMVICLLVIPQRAGKRKDTTDLQLR